MDADFAEKGFIVYQNLLFIIWLNSTMLSSHFWPPPPPAPPPPTSWPFYPLGLTLPIVVQFISLYTLWDTSPWPRENQNCQVAGKS